MFLTDYCGIPSVLFIGVGQNFSNDCILPDGNPGSIVVRLWGPFKSQGPKGPNVKDFPFPISITFLAKGCINHRHNNPNFRALAICEWPDNAAVIYCLY